MSGRHGTAAERFGVILAGILVAANLIVANLILAKFQKRWDLTRDQRFEIGTGTSRILGRIKDTVAIDCYISSNLPKRLSHLERTLIEKLTEYVREVPGRIVFRFQDPETSKDAKQQCDDLGIAAARTQEFEGNTPREIICYAALVFRHVDRKSTLNLFDEMAESIAEPARFAADLEYYITSNIQKIVNEKKTIGIMAEVQEVPVNQFDPRSEKRKTQGLDNLKGWLERSYDVLMVDPKDVNAGKPIPAEINTLLIVRPTAVSEPGQYVIDQFLMHGHAAMVLADGASVDFNPRQKQTQMGRAMVQDFDYPTYGATATPTGLETILSDYGVTFEPMIIGDVGAFTAQYIKDKQVVQNIFGQAQVQPITDEAEYPQWPIVPARDAAGKLVDEGQIAKENGIVSRVAGLVFLWPMPLGFIDENLKRNEATAETLLSSSSRSWALPVQGSTFPVLHPPEPPTERGRRPIAAMVTGRFRSAFRGKDIPTGLGDDGKPKPPSDELAKTRLNECAKPTSLVVVANGLFVMDGVLIRTIAAIESKKAVNPERAKQKPREALSFVTRAIDVLTYGGEGGDLIDVKNKRLGSREIVKLEADDPKRTNILRLNFGIVPGIVLSLGIARYIWRAATTRHGDDERAAKKGA